MSDGFWASLHLDILWPILVPQLLLMLKQWWDARVAKQAREAIKAELTKNTTATNLGNAKTDTLAAALNVDTTAPAALNADVTQPVKI